MEIYADRDYSNNVKNLYMNIKTLSFIVLFKYNKMNLGHWLNKKTVLNHNLETHMVI